MEQTENNKDLADIFCYERGAELRSENTRQAACQRIASELSVFVSARKWNQISVEIDPSHMEYTFEHGMAVLEIGIRPAQIMESSMDFIDAVSDIEDLIDATVHEIEDFDGIYISLTSPE